MDGFALYFVKGGSFEAVEQVGEQNQFMLRLFAKNAFKSLPVSGLDSNHW